MPPLLFYLLALITLGFGFMVVTGRNPVTCALSLAASFTGLAALFLSLDAYFIGIIQILVYAGAVMVLFLFGTMLTRARIGAESELNNKSWWLGVPAAGLLLGVITLALISGFADEKLPEDAAVVTTQQISDQIFGPYLLPFWGLSFVLLVAVVGAIVLARKD